VQDFTGIGNVVKFPAGVLITIPEQRVTTLQTAVGGAERQPRAELILGAAANTKVRLSCRYLSLVHSLAPCMWP
jgi:hypothetical protein